MCYSESCNSTNTFTSTSLWKKKENTIENTDADFVTFNKSVLNLHILTLNHVNLNMMKHIRILTDNTLQG